MKAFAFSLFAFVCLITPNDCFLPEVDPSWIPQQIHLSYGKNPQEIIVTWTTYAELGLALVEYSLTGQNNYSIAFGHTTRFVDGGSEARVHYIHRVLLPRLEPLSNYEYRCGNQRFWSGFYSFRTFTNDPTASAELLIYGDLGLENGQSIPRLRSEVLTGKIDAIIHNGDFGYNMDDNNSLVGDMFMRSMEPIAAYVPYQVSVGNHEEAYNFSNYNNRFSMINMFGIDAGEMNNWFYTFYMGPALFIGFSTEFYFWNDRYGNDSMKIQYDWLEKTLTMANQPEHRKRWPWLITFGHRPMYCSNMDTTDCTKFESVIRTGFGPDKEYPLESLFYKYGVDLELWSHEHSYERFFPVYNRKVYNGTAGAYINPKAPVHVITGAAGCKEFVDTFRPGPPEWSAIRNSDYGYARMNIINGTHLRIRQISDDASGKVVDDFTIVKDYHGLYTST